MSKSADAFRTISEVADWLGVPAHVLRFWESKFTQVKPVKRAGGRRYYRPADMQLLGGIRKLLHDDGMTIKGVQKIMREQGVRYVTALSPPLDVDLEASVAGIALDVPDQEDEPRGQIVSFQRRPGDTARTRDRPEDIAESGLAIPPTDEPAPQTTEAILSEESAAPAAQHRPNATAQSETDADLPAPPEGAAPEITESAARDAAVSTPARAPRITPVDTPDDPSDTSPALPSALSALAGAGQRTTMADSPRIADITRRLTDLRARMGAAGKQSEIAGDSGQNNRI